MKFLSDIIFNPFLKKKIFCCNFIIFRLIYRNLNYSKEKIPIEITHLRIGSSSGLKEDYSDIFGKTTKKENNNIKKRMRVLKQDNTTIPGMIIWNKSERKVHLYEKNVQ